MTSATQRRTVILVGLLLGRPGRSQAQTFPVDSLVRRRRYLKQRLDTLSRQVQETAREVCRQTRRSQENAQSIRFVVRGTAPNTYLVIGGLLQADFIHSRRPLGNETELKPSDIPVPNGRTPSSAFTPQSSRFFFRSLAVVGGRSVFRTWLGFDVYNPEGPTRPRLRHARAEIGDLGSKGYDAWLSAAGRLQRLPVLSGYASYDHWWSEHWNSPVGWGYVRLQPTAEQAALAPTAFRLSHYGIANLLYTPFYFFKAGLEYQYGAQQQLNGPRGRGRRWQLTVQSSCWLSPPARPPGAAICHLGCADGTRPRPATL